MSEGRTVTKYQWERILATMNMYSRESGYVDFLAAPFLFFDSDPKISSVGACFVTKQDVEKYIKSYATTEE